MKIFVTGANGQLGFKIKELLSAKHELILSDVADLDITDKVKVIETLKSIKPDVIIHGAAYTKVDPAEENRELCFKINQIGTENLAEAAREIGTKLIYISTDYVFDGKKKTPYTEEDQPNPLSVYGESKLAGEKAVAKLNNYLIFRVSWLFGELPPDYPGSNFVETMLRLAKEKPELNIVSDQVGSPTYTKDLVETIDLAIEKNIPADLYHFSGNDSCSWYDFASEIFRLANVKIKVNPITTDQYPQKAKRPPYSYLDKSKIEQALGIEVRSWQLMVGEYMENKV